MAQYHRNNDINFIIELANVDLNTLANFFVEIVHSSGEVVKRLAAKAADGFFSNDTTIIDATHLEVRIHREENGKWKYGAYFVKMYEATTVNGFQDSLFIQSDVDYGFSLVTDTETTEVFNRPIYYQGSAANGKSAYEIAVENGFVGTEAQWLTSLQGIQGPQGEPGPQGIQGPQGLQGEIGPQGADGAQGIQGPAGNDGAPGADAPAPQVQYSVDGSTAWHSTAAANDKFLRWSTDGGTTWGNALSLAGIMTGAEIKTAYEAEVNTNAYTDAEKTKLGGIEAGATADQTGAEIKAAYEAEANTNAYTDAEKSKLAGLESSKFKGTYANLTALQTAHPTSEAGAYAYVDAGVGVDVQTYIWDESDSDWVLQTGTGTAETPASVKSKYESNPDTNAYNDAAKAKVDNLGSISTWNVWQGTQAAYDALGTYDANTIYIVDGEVITGAEIEALLDARYGNTNWRTQVTVGSIAARNYWQGTQAAYDALTPDANTLYFITE